MGNESRNYWQRLTRERATRRRFLGGTAAGAAGLTGFALVGCGDDEGDQERGSGDGQESQATQPATGPRSGGSLRRQTNYGGYLNLDPHVENGGKGREYGTFYQGLVRYDPPTYDIVPLLAESWEQPSDVELIFHLQPGVKWHDRPPANGRELTADDVVFSFERMRTDSPEFFAKDFFPTVERLEAPDQATISVTLNEPDADILSRFAGDGIVILAPEVVEQAGEFATAETAVGTGAFLVESRQSEVGMRLVRNPDYWRADSPYLDAIDLHFFSNNPADERGWAAFLAGELDMAAAPGTEAQGYIAEQGSGYEPLWFEDTAGFFLVPNVRVEPFNDPRVTKALRLLVDHEEFKTAWAEVWFGRGSHASYFPSSLRSWDFEEDEYATFLEWKQSKDEAVQEAVALLGAAGFTGDSPLQAEILCTAGSYGQGGAELLNAQWARLGQGVVASAIRAVDSATYQDVRSSSEFQYGFISNGAAFNGPGFWLDEVYRSDTRKNYWGYSDPELDRMISGQRTLYDSEERQSTIKDILRHMIDNHPGVMVTARGILNVRQPQLRDVAAEWHMFGPQYDEVWLDRS
ncbi:MAG: hypothetical protein GEU28_07630 [Dehalococcoidia bacterium]|nr:hypothetical protein [Dehalococcoidia bacterium]